MIGTSLGATNEGIEARIVAVEADITPGLPQFSIVGLPDSAVNESKLRIRSAIRNAGLDFPARRITVNLSPASLRKRGAGLDLAIAVAILRASGQLPPASGHPLGLCAELGLAGKLVPVSGLVNLGLAFHRAQVPRVVIAASGVEDIVPLPGLDWLPFDNLADLVASLRHSQRPPRIWTCTAAPFGERTDTGDFAEVEGLDDVKRALTIAAAGRHHILLVGPPGSGKTMLAERFPSILPALTDVAAIEVYAIHQAAGVAGRPSLTPPLRAPHHSLTAAGLVGGGTPPTVGEATLAHHGVLLFDEVLEFSRNTLEALREPLSSRRIVLSRAGHTHTLPADFVFVATLNPCPCGYHGTPACRCPESAVLRYWSRLSGPLLDRVDLFVRVGSSIHRRNPASFATIGRSSLELRRTVESAAIRLAEGQASAAATHRRADFESAALRLLSQAARTLGMSRRGLQATTRVARTIAALAGSDRVYTPHVQEALALRSPIVPAGSGR